MEARRTRRREAFGAKQRLGRTLARLAAAVAALLVVAGGGGCGGGGGAARDSGVTDGGRIDGGAHRDAGKWCDGGCPPPPAQVAWDHSVLSTPQDQINICGVVVLPTGIAILAPPKYILLADKTDGHLIAKTPWPTWGKGASSCGPAVARSNGNLAVLMEDYPSSGEEVAVHEYAGGDLSPGKATVLSKTPGPSVIGELGGELYVLEFPSGVVTSATLDLYSIPDSGGAQTQVLASGPGTAGVPGGSLAASPAGALLTCGSYSTYGPPAVLRIDPPKTMTKTLSFSGGTGLGADCRLIAGPDRDLVVWTKSSDPNLHWDLVSADGTKLLAGTAAPSIGIFTTAYGEGAFASVRCEDNRTIYLYVTDPSTAAVRGPYNVAVPYPDIGTPAIAGEGQNLWVAYDVFGGAIHLAKLGPLPPK